MSDDTLSWLRLAEAEPTPEVAEVFERTRAKIGFVRTTQRATAHRPALVLAQDALSRAVQAIDDSGLTPREREILALVVSVENRCEACVLGHAALLRDISGDDGLVARLTVNWRHAGLSPRERALAAFAAATTRTPWESEPEHLDRLRDVGLSERDILDAAAIVAYFNFSNRLNSAIGVPSNPELHGGTGAKTS